MAQTVRRQLGDEEKQVLFDDLQSAGERFLALFEDQEFDHPAAFAEFRTALGLKEPVQPALPKSRITLPVDDHLRSVVQEYHKLKSTTAKGLVDQKVLRDQIIAAMGQAEELRFHDGTAVFRKVCKRGATTTPETTYNSLRVDWRGG